ncbi:serine/threonine-protein kinase haspin [Clonorchis sinensis]|uniref:non-specific serine/threonine protein kinase n=1 Tax=Clonorchis sinensis TaxID=79923 RepID=G7YCA7_CLOSI|nr:serine/threonine-protein kinase haspin [Clonorchis sinensis]
MAQLIDRKVHASNPISARIRKPVRPLEVNPRLRSYINRLRGGGVRRNSTQIPLYRPQSGAASAKKPIPHKIGQEFETLAGNSSSHLDVESAHRSEDVRAKTNIFCSTPGPDCHFGNSPTAIRRRRVVRIASLENLPATPIPFQEPISSGASPLKGVNRSLTQTPSSSAIGWFDPQAAKDVRPMDDSKARVASVNFRHLRRQSGMPLNLKGFECQVTVRAVLLYGCETWPLRAAELRLFQVFDACCLRTVVRVCWYWRIHNETIRNGVFGYETGTSIEKSDELIKVILFFGMRSSPTKRKIMPLDIQSLNTPHTIQGETLVVLKLFTYLRCCVGSDFGATAGLLNGFWLCGSEASVLNTDVVLLVLMKCEPTEKEAPLAVLPSVMPTKGGKKSDAFLKRLTRHFRIDNMILNQSYWEIYEAGDARATLLKLCKQTGSYKKFADVFTAHRRKQTIRKLGEGCFGEVFQCTANHVAPADLHSTTESLVAIKVIPIEGSVRFNGDCQKTFSEVLSEVIVSKELTALSLGLTNRTDSFVQLQKLHLVQGRFPSYLTKAWDQFDRERKSENDHPRIFPADQLWLLAEYAFGGSALEDNMPSCPAARLSILLQVGFALAVAEAELKFEHRDLHWENGPVDVVKFRLNDRSYEVPTYGFTAVIIDFTLSRLEQDGGLVYVNLAADPALFESRGDYQFDVYRLMRKHNKDQWERFYPRTNVFWLHYLATKLLPESTTPVARHHDAFVQRLTDLERSLSTFGFESACDLVGRHVAFNSCYCE